MGYIKEPKNIDLQIEPTKVTEEDINAISEFIQKQKKDSKRRKKNKSVNTEKQIAD